MRLKLRALRTFQKIGSIIVAAGIEAIEHRIKLAKYG